MTVFLRPNLTKKNALDVTTQAAAILREDGMRLLADTGLSEALGSCGDIQFVPEEEGIGQSDLVVTVGGDGTLLHTARLTMGRDVPLLGINTGRLGFLAALEQDELNKLHRLSGKEYSLESRGLLEVACRQGNFNSMALNDILLFKQSPERTISLDIYCDDVLVSRFRGDGVVFATPTGSTAYSMSAGGPIVDARLDSIIVTQICAHIVQTPPMVFAPDRVLRVHPLEEPGEQVFISCDGLESEAVNGADIQIRTAAARLPLVRFEDADQLKSIDKKLKGR